MTERFSEQFIFLTKTTERFSEMQAIKNDDFEEFKRLVRESGYSSYMYLQNIFSNNMPKKASGIAGFGIMQRDTWG